MEWLSGEPLFAAISGFSIPQVVELCAGNRELNAKLCDNEDFWQYRYIAERGQPPVIPASWKRAYLYTNYSIYVSKILPKSENFVPLKFDKFIADVHVNPADGPILGIYILTTDGEVYYVGVNRGSGLDRQIGKPITNYYNVETGETASMVDLHLAFNNGQNNLFARDKEMEAWIQTMEGRIGDAKLVTNPVRLNITEQISQIAGNSHETILRTITGQVYIIVHENRSLPYLLTLPFEVKFIAMNDEGFILVSQDNALYHLKYDDYGPFSNILALFANFTNPVPTIAEVPDDITQIIYPKLIVAGHRIYLVVYENTGNLLYRDPADILPVIIMPPGYEDIEQEPQEVGPITLREISLDRPVIKVQIFDNTLFALLDDGSIVDQNGKNLDVFPHPVVDFSIWKDHIWVVDTSGHVYNNGEKIALPLAANRVESGIAIWNSNGAAMPISFAYFSQLLQRGKIPKFKVPPRPGVNEPYIDTFLIPDVDGYLYEVRARYDPQTGNMTAPLTWN